MKNKFIFPFLFLICCSANLFAQINNWLWAQGSVSQFPYDCEGYAVSTDAAGNVFATGYFDTPSIIFGSTTIYDSGAGDMFLIKYDATGNLLWAKNAGGSGLDCGNSVCTDAAGDVFVTGFTQSPSITFGSTTLTNPGGMFIAKYDANGNALWAKGAGTDAISYSVSADAAGNVFATGEFRPSIAFGTTTLSNSGFGYDVFLVKYDTNGNVLWAKNPVGANTDECYSVSADVSGNAFITGYFSSPTITFGSTTLTNTVASDLFLAKYDANGNVLWAKGVSGTGQNSYSVSADPNGNVFMTGYFRSPALAFGATTLTNSGGADLFLAKYDANGNVLWAKSASGTSDDKGYSVSADAVGNFYVTGSFESSTITFDSLTLARPLPSFDPMFIVKYDTDGNVICGSALGSGGDDQCGVSADAFGNAYIGGDYELNPFAVGSTSLAGQDGEDIFVAKYTCCSLPIIVSADTTIVLGGNATLTASGGTNYSWDNGASGASIVVSPTAPTKYCVNITDSNNCRGTACITVNVEDECASDISIANAFSPNGDGQNDFVLIHSRNPSCINTFYIAIYDRWGEKVFESTDPNFKWDGSYRGQIMFSQVLDYYMTTTAANGKQYLKKGNISLVL